MSVTTASGPGLQAAVPSAYLINDIPRGTTVARLMNSLQSPRHIPPATITGHTPDVVCGIIITKSRLDDGLSVATIEFSDTPRWVQDLTLDSRGFPKSTALGTLWRGVDRSETDTHGRSVFTNAVINGATNTGLLYAEMLAEFSDTDVNTQDHNGRTALHWACVENLPDMVMLCLSVPECLIGLRDNPGLTAFDISLRNAGAGDDVIPNLFYKSMLELEHTHPDDALLRVLTVTSAPDTEKPIFPGEAIFDPIAHRNGPLVKALIDRGIDLTATNTSGDTALHLAIQLGDVAAATMLLEAGADVDALGSAGTTPLHCAGVTGQVDIAQLLVDHGAVVGAEDKPGEPELHLVAQHRAEDIVIPLTEAEMDEEVGQDRSTPESSDTEQSENQDGHTAPVDMAEQPGGFTTTLALSCMLPMQTTEWVRAVDKELLAMIAITNQLISVMDCPSWDDVTKVLDWNPAIRRMGDRITVSEHEKIQTWGMGFFNSTTVSMAAVRFYPDPDGYRKLMRYYISSKRSFFPSSGTMILSGLSTLLSARQS